MELVLLRDLVIPTHEVLVLDEARVSQVLSEIELTVHQLHYIRRQLLIIQYLLHFVDKAAYKAFDSDFEYLRLGPAAQLFQDFDVERVLLVLVHAVEDLYGGG